MVPSNWIVADITARNALIVTPADVYAGHECYVLSTGEIYRCVRPLTSASAWAPVGVVYPTSGLSEIGGALADTDKVNLLDVSDTSGGTAGTLKNFLLSRLKTWALAAADIGEALASGDLFMVGNASDSNAFRTTTLSAIATGVGSLLNIASGTWTPTFTYDGASVATSVTLGEAIYARAGSAVAFGIRITAVTYSGTGSTDVRATLPVSSNFATANNVIGVVSADTTTVSAGRVSSEQTSDLIRMRWEKGTDTTSHNIYVTGIYRVI